MKIELIAIAGFAAAVVVAAIAPSFGDSNADRTDLVMLDSMEPNGYVLHRTIDDGLVGSDYRSRDAILMAREALQREPSPCQNNPHPILMKFSVENRENSIVYDVTLRCF